MRRTVVFTDEYYAILKDIAKKLGITVAAVYGMENQCAIRGTHKRKGVNQNALRQKRNAQILL